MTDGWQYICWAFLRPGDGHTFSYVDQRCRLQLFEYRDGADRRGFAGKRFGQRAPRHPNVFAQWQMGGRRIKYPATIDVSLKAVRALDRPHEQLRRPQNAFQVDRRDELPLHMAALLAATTDADAAPTLRPEHVPNLPTAAPDSRWLRPVGQPCVMPNRLVAKVRAASSRGSLVSRFAPNGRRLAVAVVPLLPHQPHDICVLSVPACSTELTLSGHSGLVYALEWYDATSAEGSGDVDDRQLLLSVSADRMAIVWRLHATAGTYDWVILPHPCFVYAGIFLAPGERRRRRQRRRTDDDDVDVLCVTGGRDQVVRVWSGSGSLLQELHGGHEDYITAVVGTRTRVFSVCWSGTIVEWTRLSGEPTMGAAVGLFDAEPRTVAQLGGTVRQMQLNRAGDQLYVLLNGAHVVSVSVRTGARVRSFELRMLREMPATGSPDELPPPCFTLTACGTLLLGVSDGGRMLGWSLLDVAGRMKPFRLPMMMQQQQRRVGGGYVTGLDYCRRSFLCSVTTFGGRSGGHNATGDAGVYLVGWAGSDETPPAVAERPAEMVVEQRQRMMRTVDHQQRQDLNRIIQRLDDIFQRPQNKTDDVKAGGSLAACDGHDDAGGDAIEMQTLGTESLTRSGTFVIKRSDPSNRTFIVPRTRKTADRTFSVSAKELADIANADDGTTVSESL